MSRRTLCYTTGNGTGRRDDGRRNTITGWNPHKTVTWVGSRSSTAVSIWLCAACHASTATLINQPHSTTLHVAMDPSIVMSWAWMRNDHIYIYRAMACFFQSFFNGHGLVSNNRNRTWFGWHVEKRMYLKMQYIFFLQHLPKVRKKKYFVVQLHLFSALQKKDVPFTSGHLF